ncbi:MAG: hypothetical protein N3E45_05275 [Oscillatoriaceae bacterium SKW80]|nr:hypothetical protein [Oscillatoriaceae bacterium SKYG93]MCX8120226.1 hypothetical protein [Oscillatoriaceae bacterium SKW80]MDW8453152.1 hypothetical protein [Oscillatoriaceae cyanobacterium SKYGB_i_bin93]HIK28936.1 hypothetical protein [Oscillatoriaceae cyanobacterium M7585_C2015_266]
MFYLILHDQNNMKNIFPEGVPTFSSVPDDFIETYNEFGELDNIQPAFRVNMEGLTEQQELKLFNLYASEMDDPSYVKGCFRLLQKGWIRIPADEVKAVVWREGEKVVLLPYEKDTALAY